MRKVLIIGLFIIAVLFNSQMDVIKFTPINAWFDVWASVTSPFDGANLPEDGHRFFVAGTFVDSTVADSTLFRYDETTHSIVPIAKEDVYNFLGLADTLTDKGYQTESDIAIIINDSLRNLIPVPGGIKSFIANGINNSVGGDYGFATGNDNDVIDYTNMGKVSDYGFASGWLNKVYDYGSFASGVASIADGKITHAVGNTVMVSANDSHGEGNRTVAGRKRFNVSSYGSEDAGSGLGVLPYMLIPDVFGVFTYGDVTSYFPNALTDNVTSRYGSGAQMDAQGNIYASGFTPATWSGDSVTNANDLKWALHSYCVIKGGDEIQLGFFKIKKTVYTAGVGTKIYYQNSGNAYSVISSVYSSYSPVLLGGGNGQHVEGRFTSSWNYGSHAEGESTNAWGYASHAEGYITYATGNYSHTEGTENISSGIASHSEGYGTTASGNYSHSGGYSSNASGLASFTQGIQTTASGEGSFSTGKENNATSKYSSAFGYQSNTNWQGQVAFANGYFTTDGDAQTSIYISKYTSTAVGHYWFDILPNMQFNKTYLGETKIVLTQTAGTKGRVGESASYQLDWTIAVGEADTITSVDVSNEWLIFSSSTNFEDDSIRVIYTSTGSVVGNLTWNYLYYIVETKGDSIKLSSTLGGTPINFTSIGSGIQTIYPFDIVSNTRTLLGRNFKNDGDDVGDGLTTGIRTGTGLSTSLSNNKGACVAIFGLTNRTIRWVASTIFTEVGTQ